MRAAANGSGRRHRQVLLQSRSELLAAAVQLPTRVPDAMALFLLSPLADGVLAGVRMGAVELEPGDDTDPLGTGRRIVALRGRGGRPLTPWRPGWRWTRRLGE